MSHPKQEDARKGLASASRMDRVKHCPGSLAAEAGLEEDADQDPSMLSVQTEGDEAHAAMEAEDFDSIDDEEVKRLAEGLKELETEAMDRFCQDLQLSKQEAKSIHIVREERFWIKDGAGNDIASAQPDLVAIYGESALVLDYKTGYLPVTETARNMQIRTQVLAVWKNRPELKFIRGSVAAYRLTGSLKSVDYDVTSLWQAQRELKFVLWRAREQDAERVPGEWCRYCLAKSRCPQAAAYALIGIPYIGAETKHKDLPQAALDLNLRQLAAVHLHRSMAGKIFTAVHNRLRNMTDPELATVLLKKTPGRNVHNFDRMWDLYSRLVGDGLMEGHAFIEHCRPKATELAKTLAPKLQESSRVPLSATEAEEAASKILLEYAQTSQAAATVKKMTREEIKKHHGEKCSEEQTGGSHRRDKGGGRRRRRVGDE